MQDSVPPKEVLEAIASRGYVQIDDTWYHTSEDDMDGGWCAAYHERKGVTYLITACGVTGKWVVEVTVHHDGFDVLVD